MDKETLSNYGWIVICILVLSVMIALATPFGNYIKTAVENTTEGLFETSNKGLSTVGASADNSNFAFTDGTVKHHYYSSIALAVSDAGEHTTANADCDKDTASAEIAVREKDDKYIVKALKNQTITESIEMKGEQIFDTNSKEIELKAGVELKPVSNSVITFRDEGGKGKIYKDVDSTSAEALITTKSVNNCSVTILNGTYNISNNNGRGIAVWNNGNNKINIQSGNYAHSSSYAVAVIDQLSDSKSIVINGGNFTAQTEDKTATAIYDVETIKNANVKAIGTNDSKSNSAKIRGITLYMVSTGTIENTNVVADYHLYNNSSKEDYECEGITINTNTRTNRDGTFFINNCNVKGTREGLSLMGQNAVIYINGGVYQGIRHGGAYFGVKKAVVQNATFKKWDYDGQFEKDKLHSWNANFYVGATLVSPKVYMNHCKVDKNYKTVISSNYEYKDTYLYASNTSFGSVRIDGPNENNNQGHFYVGKNATYTSTEYNKSEVDTL